jgi:hypothetical protein
MGIVDDLVEDVDRRFILFQGLVTVEESDLIVARQTDEGLELVGRLTFNELNRPRDEIVAALLEQSPDIPPALLRCSDLSRFAP